MDEFITKETCMKILNNFSRKSFNGIKYISHEFKPISENVEGFMGEHYKLFINYETKGDQKYQIFFVKNKPLKNKSQGEITDALGMYPREIFVYDFLLKEFEKYGYDTSFAATSYYTIPDLAIVMEDVTLDGFSITERSVNLTKDHLKCTLKSLALYHAAGYAYERTKSKELNRKFILGEEFAPKLDEFFYIQYIDQNMPSMKWWNSCLKTLDAFIDFLPHDDAYKQEFRQMVDQAELSKAFVTKTKINKTCGHGDLWSNNMLFKYENNKPIRCCLVDFQVCRYFYPCVDILLSIFCNTDSKFRKLHLEELYQYYHKSLGDILDKYGYDVEEIHPLKDFYESIDMVKVETIIQNLLTSIIILLPKDQIIERMTDNEEGAQQILFDNTELAVAAFKNNSTYRNTICDIIYELREALLKRCKK